ncbi:hypothetical protein LuPra_02933 [Luteitalea pratensis]|uniref:Uncharacterized protein n=1 Tax=Luteitalea pratensis TaxID=1855912 RepID=A0A143PPG9_LUTPR|nr:hypothetical protein LuPra_02933 [Luteitalea pratensis]
MSTDDGGLSAAEKYCWRALNSSWFAEEEGRATDFVGARLGRHRHRGATGHALRGIEGVGRDVDRLDRFYRRHVANVMRQPHVDRGRAVDTPHVVVTVGAVDVGRQRAARGIGLRVLEGRRRCAGHQVHEPLVVPVLVEREVDDVGRLEVDRDVRLVGLEQRGFGRHRDRLGHGAHRQLAVDAHDVVLGNGDACVHVFLEALEGGLQGVGARLEVADGVCTRVVGDRRHLEPGALVGHRDGRAWNERTRVVHHSAGNGAVERLRRGRGREQGDHRGQHACQSAGEKGSNRLHSHLRLCGVWGPTTPSPKATFGPPRPKSMHGTSVCP